MLLDKSKLSLYQNYIFVLMAFVLPISTAGVSLSIVLIAILWMIEGDFRRKFDEIKANYVALAIFGFLGLHLLGFMWLNVEPVNPLKSSLLLLTPIVMTSIKKEFIPKIFASFIVAMTLSEAISYWKIFNSWGDTTLDPRSMSPFVSTITYSPFLAFSIAILLISLMQKQSTLRFKIIFIFFIITMSMNIFLTGGRAGQVALFVVLCLIAIYYFYEHKKILITVLMLVPLIYYALYSFNHTFKMRVDSAIHNVMNYADNSAEENLKTDVGARLLWTLTSWEIIKEKPLFGHGSGSFQNEYARKNHELSPQLPPTHNPHNNYILVMVQFGIIGLVSLLAIFWTQILAFKNSQDDEYKPLRLILPLMFAVICLSDTYLWGHHTQALFALFSGILYANQFQKYGKNTKVQE